ncbi:multidrug effflux MFS transporter [Marinobacterium sediminicola]|uniref:Bcr/CflA family efflux transporter n=1 Tax=Marinobacterium sediminicola TaxID=518898 RepID=A0ABY1RW19_9GAMM|nr:multidrug effflux MFS transporter [Marinobacterium sediminicola]ULG70470.1 multidrug effflux MFS transporter [Marinobacterium sediminicola]SMR69258.1 MFS transporter, DHA1 family, bicyclomycin/chloramphenicol resistance protein [Marinobacterium sediminicola]
MTAKHLHIPGLILMLAGLTALAPLSTDAYLPAIPTIAAELGISIHQVELSVSLFLAGFACGQLTGGPFSDRFGRRKAIFTGLSLFFLGACAAMLANSIETLLAARILQGFGGGVSVVNSAAVIRDRHSGRESARAMSRMASILMTAPLLAPVLGTVLLEVANWRSIFFFLASYALLMLLVLWLKLPETRTPQPGPMPNPLRSYATILSHRTALGYLLSVAFSYAGMFAFITGSSGSYIHYYGASPSLYTVLFGLNIVTLLACNQINIRLLHRFSSQQLLQMAQRVQLLTAGILMLVFTLTEAPLWVVVVLIMFYIGVQGFVISNGMAGTSEFFPNMAATAAALVGASGFAAGALAGSLVGLLGDGTPLPMIAVMLTSSIAGNLLGLWLLPRSVRASHRCENAEN